MNQKKNVYPQLQLAIDVLSIHEMIQLVDEVCCDVDILEIGTPLIIETGLAAVEAAKQRYPDKTCLADLKIMDAGRIEATSGFERGSDIVTVLATADDKTIGDALEVATKYGGQLMVDLINVADPVGRAVELDRLGAHILCLHTACDVQDEHVDPLGHLTTVREAVGCTLAIAGGLKLENVADTITGGADIMIVGGAIVTNADPKKMASQIAQAINKQALMVGSQV